MESIILVHKIPIGNLSPQKARVLLAEYANNYKVKLPEMHVENIFTPSRKDEATVECIYPVPGVNPHPKVQDLKFSKLRDVKPPTRGTEKSAGIDFFIPEDYNDGQEMKINPQSSVLIPSGIKVNIPEGYALIAFNKSGIATKKGFYVGAAVVDEDYQGEMHIHFTNVGDKPAFIKGGDKIMQFILIPVLYAKVEEVMLEDLYEAESVRGAGGFGSTGTV